MRRKGAEREQQGCWQLSERQSRASDEPRTRLPRAVLWLSNSLHNSVVQDILRSVPTAYPLFIVDSCLGALTDQRPFRRRLAFFFLVVLYTASFRTIWTAGHDYTPKAIRTAVASLDSELAADALAAAYVPLPPTTAQQESYARILELIESRSSAFPARLFTERALTAPNARVVGVTAVVLHWKRRKGLELVIKQITRYPFIREVIVWNNRPGVELRSSVSTASPPSCWCHS